MRQRTTRSESVRDEGDRLDEQSLIDSEVEGGR
jgi:hypothetical protein